MKKIKKKDELRELMKQNLTQIKEQNSALLTKLEGKKKKIEELKVKIKLQEAEIKAYQQKEEDWRVWKEKYEMANVESRRKKNQTESWQKP